MEEVASMAHCREEASEESYEQAPAEKYEARSTSKRRCKSSDIIYNAESATRPSSRRAFA